MEPNFYVWIPAEKEPKFGNHRLTLRKNMDTGKFEVYRSFRNGTEDVIYEGRFEAALKAGCVEYRKFHGRDLNDKACRHRKPNVDRLCPSFNVRIGRRRGQI